MPPRRLKSQNQREGDRRGDASLSPRTAGATTMNLKMSAALLVLPLGFSHFAAAQESPILKRIAERGVINMGYREGAVPFSYIGPDGKPVGYAIDLCMKVIDRVKETMKKPDIKINLVPVTSANRIPLM